MTPAALPRPDHALTPLPLHTHLELAALPSAVACARGHVKSVMREWGLADISETAELLVSELITNAVRVSEHLNSGPGAVFTPVVHLWLTADGFSLDIHVWDGSGELPVRKNAAPDQEGGRGLMLVEALSADWGCYRLQEGKMVWARVSRP